MTRVELRIVEKLEHSCVSLGHVVDGAFSGTPLNAAELLKNISQNQKFLHLELSLFVLNLVYI